MIHDVLLLLMCIAYGITIYFVYKAYINNYSISSIVCDNECNKFIITSMSIMCFFTMLYELYRNESYVTLLSIMFLIIGIMGVLHSNEKEMRHFIYATIVFVSILVFMFYMSYIYNYLILQISFYLQITLTMTMLLTIKNNIFFAEVFALMNFMIFYFYLHYICYYK